MPTDNILYFHPRFGDACEDCADVCDMVHEALEQIAGEAAARLTDHDVSSLFLNCVIARFEFTEVPAEIIEQLRLTLAAFERAPLNRNLSSSNL